MSYFDLRYAFLLALNIVKSQVALPWEWDPFDLATHFTFSKFWLLSLLLFIFSFVSVGIPLTPPDAMGAGGYVRIQVKSFSSSFTISFFTLLFTPQILFWYIYPSILLFLSCCACLANVWLSFVYWVQAVLSFVPDFDISVTAASVVDGGGDRVEGDVEDGRGQI